MNTDEMRECLDGLGWSQRQLSSILDVDEGTVRKWARGRNQIPESIAQWLKKLHSFHLKNPPPSAPNKGVQFNRGSHEE